MVSILKHGAVVAGLLLQCKLGDNDCPPCGLCPCQAGAPSVHDHEVDNELRLSGGRNAAEPAPLAMSPGGHWGCFLGHSMRRTPLECLNITPPLRPTRFEDSKKTFVKLQTDELGSAVGVLKALVCRRSHPRQVPGTSTRSKVP